MNKMASLSVGSLFFPLKNTPPRAAMPHQRCGPHTPCGPGPFGGTQQRHGGYGHLYALRQNALRAPARTSCAPIKLFAKLRALLLRMSPATGTAGLSVIAGIFFSYRSYHSMFPYDK